MHSLLAGSKLKRLFRSKKVLILGSGPRSNEPMPKVDLVIYINGATSHRNSSLEQNSRVVVFLNEEMVIPEPQNIQRSIALANSQIFPGDLVISLRTNLEALRSNAKSALPTANISIRLGHLRRMLRKATGSKYIGSWPFGLTSTGFAALGIVAWSGAETVWIDGFTITTPTSLPWGGHLYDDAGDQIHDARGEFVSQRDHACQDALLLTSLTVAGHDLRAFTPELRALTNLYFEGHFPKWVTKRKLLSRYVFSQYSIF